MKNKKSQISSVVTFRSFPDNPCLHKSPKIHCIPVLFNNDLETKGKYMLGLVAI